MSHRLMSSGAHSNTGALIYDLGIASVMLHCSTVLSFVVLHGFQRLGVVLLYSIHLQRVICSHLQTIFTLCCCTICTHRPGDSVIV